ncbi:hypothetical protein FrEUN1fDRAFT_3132 [Parafrankia sp. EUN1f]|nr:hypothetical protein FrEUN1fDRAFT_3132 [Parafrankia sp. EUN1f]
MASAALPGPTTAGTSPGETRGTSGGDGSGVGSGPIGGRPGRPTGRIHNMLLWILTLIAAIAAIAGAVGAGESLGDTALDLLPGVALLFSLAHGSCSAGWRGIGAFFGISYVVAFALEASSVASGFPFGFYEHNTGGPRLLDIPLVVPLAYFGYGWIAWVLAAGIVRAVPARSTGAERFTTPLVAAVVLTGWDFTFDAVFATVNSQYDYRHPGGFYGVPISNFLGWLLTGWVIFQLFAVVETRVSHDRPASTQAARILPSVVWALPVLPLLGFYLSPPPGEVTVGERTFVIGDIYGTAFVTGLMTLGFVAVLALARTTRR